MAIQNRAQPLPFLVTTEMPCPYLAGRVERKVVTDLSGPGAADTYEILSRAGFRRSHSIAYRPACPGCSACVAVRVVVAGFAAGPSLRRIARRNDDLVAALRPTRGTPEQFALFTRYLGGRHQDGEMVGMSLHEYVAMVEDSPLQSNLVELRDGRGRLVGCCLVDWTRDGVSAVYSFYDVDQPRRSLGSYLILWLIGEAARRGLPYAYLGYWVAGSRKMAYKSRFRPLEGYGRIGWEPLTDDNDNM
jgi:leucyl-tRNA---protein transferase